MRTMFNQRIGGFTQESREQERMMRKSSMELLKHKLGSELENEVERCKHNLALNLPCCIKCCKTCDHCKTFGRYGNYFGNCPTTMGCSELGIAVSEFWCCGKWSCKKSLMVAPDIQVNEDFVAEALNEKKQQEAQG